MPWCDTCGELIFGQKHTCPTAWSALVTLDREDLDHEFADGTIGDGYEYTVHAWDAERAAEKAAKEYDPGHGEYAIAGDGEPAYVKLCKRDEESPSQYFVVSGDMEPTYSAKALGDDDEG